jgi:YesN/AraC family two-component response regulator
MKVLIVDDSKLARMAMTKALNTVRPEWTRIEASNADEALALVRSEGPDITMLDFNMPGRDGLVLAAEIREVNPAIQVAVISANHQQEVVDHALSLGATFLFKPLTEKALGNFIEIAEKKLKTESA